MEQVPVPSYPNIDDLKERLENLLELLKNPQLGLMSWHMFYGESVRGLLDFWNDDDDEDWTAKDGVSNASDEYLAIVDTVARILGHLTLGCSLHAEARLIVSTLAHKAKLAPRGK